MRLMEKKLIIALAVFLFAGIVANAQIGVTRDGRLRMPYYGLAFHNSFDIGTPPRSWDYPFPVCQPHTRSITITEKELEYNQFTEEWEIHGHGSRYLIIFDTLGNMVESFMYELGINTDGTFYHNVEKGHNVFTYDNNRIVKITKVDEYGEQDLFAFKYDKNGNVVKILQNGDDVIEYRIVWYSKDYVSSITAYQKGNLYEACSINYQIVRNGQNLVFKEKKWNTTYIDAHGVKTRIDWEHWIDHYENSYDENGNLIKQLEYENKAAGKYFKRGVMYEYEYEFYD